MLKINICTQSGFHTYLCVESFRNKNAENDRKYGEKEKDSNKDICFIKNQISITLILQWVFLNIMKEINFIN